VKLKSDQPDLPLKSGHNYEFKVKINKTTAEIEAEAKVVGWMDGGLHNAGEVFIDIVPNTSIGNAGITDNSQLLVSVDGQKGQYSYGSGTWTAVNHIYWDNIKFRDDLVAKGLLFLSTSLADINDIPENIFEGNSQELKEKAQKYIQFGNMEHPFAKIDVIVKSDYSKDSKVELHKINKVSMVGFQKFKEVITDRNETDFMEINYEAADYTFNIDESDITPAGAATKYELPTMYVEPLAAKLSIGTLLLNIYVEEASGIENVYPLKLKAEQSFNKNTHYTIEITLSKTEITDPEVKVTAWKNGDNVNGGATIDD